MSTATTVVQTAGTNAPSQASVPNVTTPPRAHPLARDLRVVVHDAEDAPARVAVSEQRGVTVDAAPAARTAVHQLAHASPAAAVPAAVDPGANAEFFGHGLEAEARPGRGWQSSPVK